MDKMTSEIEALTKAKCCLERALAEIENLIYIAQECLYYREKRYGIDQCHDDVENSLILVSISAIVYSSKAVIKNLGGGCFLPFSFLFFLLFASVPSFPSSNPFSPPPCEAAPQIHLEVGSGMQSRPASTA